MPRMLQGRATLAIPACLAAALLVSLATLGVANPGETASGHRMAAKGAQLSATTGFSFLASPGTSREIMNFGSVSIRARCSGSGDLSVTLSSFGPVQIQSASTDTLRLDDDAYNEVVTGDTTEPVNLLPHRDVNQIGHTEVAKTKPVSINWQADNPGEPRDTAGPGGPDAPYTCVFTGTAVRLP